MFLFFLSQLENEAKRMKQTNLFVASVLGFEPLSLLFPSTHKFILGLSCDITRSHSLCTKTKLKAFLGYCSTLCRGLFFVLHASLNNVDIESKSEVNVRVAILTFSISVNIPV